MQSANSNAPSMQRFERLCAGLILKGRSELDIQLASGQLLLQLSGLLDQIDCRLTLLFLRGKHLARDCEINFVGDFGLDNGGFGGRYRLVLHDFGSLWGPVASVRSKRKTIPRYACELWPTQPFRGS